MNYSHQEHNRALDRLMADMQRLPERACINCNRPTTGSVWADGQVCRAVCPDCKRAADEQAERSLAATVRAFDCINPLARRVARIDAKRKPCPICNGEMTWSPAEQDRGDHTGWNTISDPAMWGCTNPECEHTEVDDE